VSWQYGDLKILWTNDWYDGPLSGISVHDGDEVYFSCLEDHRLRRVFGLYRMTPEMRKDEYNRHNDFVRLVGTNYDFRIPPSERKYVYTKESFAEFYIKHPPDSYQYDLSRLEKIGLAYGPEPLADDYDEEDRLWSRDWSHLCTVFAACAALEQQRVSILAEHLWGRR
jgi:hypothetical protein